jgi:hypothetical protein
VNNEHIFEIRSKSSRRNKKVIEQKKGNSKFTGEIILEMWTKTFFHENSNFKRFKSNNFGARDANPDIYA